MRKAIYASLSVALAGCGGAGDIVSSSSSSISSSSISSISSSSASSFIGSSSSSSSLSFSSSSSAIQVQPYFVEVSNALSMYNTFDNTMTHQPIPIDINHDGLDDLVIIQHGFSSNVTTSNVCNNIIKLYIMSSDGTFFDQTSSYINTNNFGGCPGAYVLADINNDGKTDFVTAMNNEDGRSFANASDVYSQLSAFVSEGNGYKLIKFGTFSWYGSVGIGYDKDDNLYVTANGYGPFTDNIYYFNKGTSSYTTVRSGNYVSATSFKFFSSNNSKKYTDLLLQTGISTTAEGYQQNSNGQWVSTGNITFINKAATIKEICYTGDYCGEYPVFRYKNYIMIAALDNSCKLKMTPNSDPIIVFSLTGQGTIYDPNIQYDGMTIRQNDLNKFIYTFRAATIKNGVTVEVPIYIENEQPEMNSNYFDCKDINNDGYDDIVAYPFSHDGLPIIYLNNKNNGFTYLDKTKLPSVSACNLGWELYGCSLWPSGSSFVHDFDHDGINDILIFAGQNVSGFRWINYRFFRGQNII